MRRSSLLGRKKVGTPESRNSRLIMLPQVEVKASDDVRLDLRGHKIRSLSGGRLHLSPNLEFVYLRDNLLSTLDGIGVLKRVKVLDLSFNEFKGPGFEPLENCKALQQLYLAGNQIVSLKSLPELPNLEFLSVAQNKLKSLSMTSQPRLQVLAASENKISTLKGFPYLPALEHLRVEENPILKMSHLEAASILLVGPTLKKFNGRDLSREEITFAKRYPSNTALCIRSGWDLCAPEQAVDSTFKFMLEQWKEQLPPGYLLKRAAVDQPFEEDACSCHFEFVTDTTKASGVQLNLKYQWFIGEQTASNFTPISNACGEIYFPKCGDTGRILKVECTPIMEDTEYPPIFAVSSPICPGTGIPKTDVSGELIEGSKIKGSAEVACCGGTPGKGVARFKELMAPVENIAVSTETLRRRLLQEGMTEAAIQDCEQIMRNEFASLTQKLLETEKVDMENTVVDESHRQLNDVGVQGGCFFSSFARLSVRSSSSRFEKSGRFQKIPLDSADRLSGLPDEILCHILSFLSTKISAQTSILSRRWRFLWAYVPNLIFEEELSEAIVSRIIFILRKAETVNTFRITDHIKRLTSYHLESWMIYATAHNLQNLDIQFLWGDTTLPPCIFTCKTLVDLRISEYGDHIRTYAACLPRLKKLHLIECYLENDETLPNLLSGCPVLEELELIREDMTEGWWIEPQQVPTCLLTHLKFIKLVDLRDLRNIFEIMKYLLKNARVLERMEIGFPKSFDSEQKIVMFQEEISSFQRASEACEVVFVTDV